VVIRSCLSTLTRRLARPTGQTYAKIPSLPLSRRRCRHLERVLAQAEENGADLAIIDTAGRTNDAALAAAKVADLVFVPLQPSLVDLGTVKATLDIIRMAGNPRTVALLTASKQRASAMRPRPRG